MNVAAEYFATMADVYRLAGEPMPKHDMAETADGKGKTELESARRLARMIGHDVETKPIEVWKTLAKTCKTLQMNHISAAVAKHLKPNMMIIGAGAGSFLVQQIAHQLNCAYQPISMLLTGHILINTHNLKVCFPAFAVALLAKKQLARQNA